ncbi:metal ABC transporter substrate-binding protein [Paenibacillus algicola]|nr:metal ABC transporter substrate-binding protein [Paenibacillus algicola]
MNRWSKWLSKTAFVSLGLVVMLTGCGNEEKETVTGENGEAERLNVVTTFYPMYEFSKQIAGEHADVVALVPAGVEPHDWEPSPQDMAKIKEADIFVYNGGVEGWVEDALSSASSEKRIVVKASEGIELMEGENDGHNHGHHHGHEEGHEGHEEGHGEGHEEGHEGHDEGHDHEGESAGEHEEEHDHTAEDKHDHEEGDTILDPHVWLDPSLAQKQVATILEAYEQADPAHAASYASNAEAYIAKLQELDQSFEEALKAAKRTEFITQHAAFGYLAKRYGLTQIAIAGLSPDQEPSPDRMAEIITFAKEHDVKTIFFEKLVQPKVAQTIANEIGARTDVLNPLEGLTEEDLKQNLDYIGAMEMNRDALKKALVE